MALCHSIHTFIVGTEGICLPHLILHRVRAGGLSGRGHLLFKM